VIQGVKVALFDAYIPNSETNRPASLSQLCHGSWLPCQTFPVEERVRKIPRYCVIRANQAFNVKPSLTYIGEYHRIVDQSYACQIQNRAKIDDSECY
jgi:hypothetical protein